MAELLGRGKVQAAAVQELLEGKAETVLVVLYGRGLTVSAAQRKQILACTDLSKLDAWARAALTTASTTALLAGGAPPRRTKRAT